MYSGWKVCKKKASADCATPRLCLRKDSNLHRKNRNLKFYPLNYGAVVQRYYLFFNIG